ncbi:MAG TPA: SLBB domain-containing protein [Victivallales bacterium]|nr:SLBB domain-containing protein [Victivallales bacterium]HPO90519.1 SLBB domain-containing protein [Victivallales bacterium]HRU00479.1 SLBB domain-containing protein [Victivallales bacterium]
MSPSTQTESFVSVVGAVQKPGKIEIKDGDRLLDAITNAGGLLFINDIWGGRAVANLNSAYISRNGEKLNVNLDKLLREGDMTQNILLKAGDFIYFPESDTSNIIVLGEVKNPNIIPFTRNISLLEALSRCGGFTEKAQKGTVIVLRVDGEKNTVMKKVDLEAILYGKENASGLALKGGDIVFVPEQGLSEYERYAGYLMTFADLILRAYQVREQIRFPRLHRRDSFYY